MPIRGPGAPILGYHEARLPDLVGIARDRANRDKEAADFLLRQRQQTENERSNRAAEAYNAGMLAMNQQAQRERMARQAQEDEVNRRARYVAARAEAARLADAGDWNGARFVMINAGFSPQDAPVPPPAGLMAGPPRGQQFGDGVMPLSLAPQDRAGLQQGQQNVRDFLAGNRQDVGSNAGAVVPQLQQQFNQGGSPGPMATRTGPGQFRMSPVEFGGKPDSGTVSFLPPETSSAPAPGPAPAPAHSPPGAGALTFRGPDGQIVTIDPEAQRRVAEQRRQQEIQRYAGLFQDDGKDLEIARINADARRSIEAGLNPEKVMQERNDLVARLMADRTRIETTKKRGGGGSKGDSSIVYDPNTGEAIGKARDATTARATGAQVGSIDEGIAVATRLKGSYEEGLAPGGIGEVLSDPMGVFGRLTDRVQLSRSLAITAKEIARLGALSGPDEAIINDVIGGKWTQWTGAGGAQRMQRFIELAQQQRERLLNAAGVNRNRQGNPLEAAAQKTRAGNRQAASRLLNGGKSWDDAADELIGGGP